MKTLSKSVLYAISLGGGLAIWQVLTRHASAVLIAPPSAVLVRLATELASGTLFWALMRSLGALAAGFAIALAIAVPLGMAIGRSRRLGAIFNPVINALYAIPPVAMVPFLVIWFGLFYQARVALVVFMSFFEILVTVEAGARNVDPMLPTVGRSFGCRRLQLARHVILPASLPFLFTAFRIGLVRAINGMITAELFFAAVNLGALMKDSEQRFDTAGILAIIVLLCLLGLASQEGVKAAESRLLPWHLRA